MKNASAKFGLVLAAAVALAAASPALAKPAHHALRHGYSANAYNASALAPMPRHRRVGETGAIRIQDRDYRETLGYPF
jgi:hypothetical protein